MKKKYICLSLLFISFLNFGQRITVNTTQNPTQLVSNLLNSGVCSSISNVTTSPGLQTTGNTSPYGSYVKNGTNNVFTQGLIISTGFAKNAGNTVINTTLGDNLGTGGDTDLANAFSITSPAALADAAFIEFDFIPIKTSISFRYFLASEEYQYNKNYPCLFSDAFAFLLKDNAVGVYNNIALVPGTNIPVGISTVRPDLSGLTGGCPAANANYFNGYNQNPPNVDGTNFNGSTKALTAFATVIPGHSYHIKLVIADYGSTTTNRLFDSAVFIESGSFDLAGYFTDQNTVTLSGSAISCSSNPLVLNPVSQILNPTYQWYKDGAAIPAPLGTASTYQIPVGGTGNYSLVVTDSQSGCVDDIPVLFVQVIDAPLATDQSFCTGATVANLVATGTNIKWYTTLTGGTALDPSTLLTSGTYFASQTVGSCETTRTQINVTVGNTNPTFDPISICFGATLTLPSISTNGVNGNWSPALNNTATTTYTFTPISGQCANSVQLTVNVNPNVSASFTIPNSVCNASTVPVLPTTSTNGITGTWSPDTISNTASGVYTFTPTTLGQYPTCYLGTNQSITVTSPNISPTFTQVNPICSGATLTALPTSSSNGITGTWSPSLNNTATTTYTFAPDSGQCAINAQMIITVNPLPTVTASNVSGCSGNPITLIGSPIGGTYSTGSSTYTGTSTTYTYTYTDGNGCTATSAPANITVNPTSIPTFTPIAPICNGSSTVPTLPSTSLEGIQGTWSPSVVDPTISQSYTFTPTSGQCTTTSSQQVTVVNNFDFSINSGCVDTNFIVDVITTTGFNNTNASYNWSVNNILVGSNNPSFNVTDYVNSLQTPQQLPVIISATVTDGSGCPKTKSITVTDLFCNIQKGISPNGDNKNDFFDLQNLEVKKLSIYNRYGMKVYTKDGYRNEWYGQSDSNQDLPDATYYYVIEFNNDTPSKTGWIYLSRAN